MSDRETPEAVPPAGGETTSPEIGDVAVVAVVAGVSVAPEAPVAPDGSEGSGAAVPARRRNPFYLRGRRVHLPSSKRGLIALLMVLGAMGFVGVFGGVSLVHWTETADFCGRCHTMDPELEAYKIGAHAEVTCGECHVEPGIAGWMKAKLNGTRQLVSVVLGTYPTPIPPPEHSALPKASDTCEKCHDVEREALAVLKASTQFLEDEPNTRTFVGLMIRPGGGDALDAERGVHWHVIRELQFASPDEDKATIDYVVSAGRDGSTQEYIAQDKISVAEDVQPDIDAILATETVSLMTCYDCHNRAGHNIPNPRTDMDYELFKGVIDPTLQYIKREGMRLLWAGYPDDATADAEIDKLNGFYALNYPEVAASKAAQVDSAVEQIKALHRVSSTPPMKVTPGTYPNHLGHMDFPGCFRCHDGGHFLVKDGVATKQTIPSACNTCHTFPQIGPAVASLPLGEPPTTHGDDLWVFNHRDVATQLDPGGQSCGECHARDYCVNCHATGAVTVQHDVMATNHAQVIRDQGNTACAYCHQPVYCARCHAEQVLPVTSPSFHGTAGGAEGGAEGTTLPDLPTGVAWPLTPRS